MASNTFSFTPQKRGSYKPVPQESQVEDQVQAPTSRWRSSKRTLILRYIASISLLTFLILSTILITTHNRNHPTIYTSCGSTPSEARSRNCSFDLISFAWQLPPCYDAPLIAEFQSWSNWTLYNHKYSLLSNTSSHVPVSVALQGETDLWVDWKYHITHCTFMWRQMHRAYERGWIDAHLGAYNHTLHCQEMILREVPEESRSVITKAPVIYPVCERVGARRAEGKGEKGRGWWDKVYGS